MAPTESDSAGLRAFIVQHTQVRSLTWLVALVVLMVLLRAPFWVSPGWSVDSYSILMGVSGELNLSQGRVGQSLIYLVLHELGFNRFALASLGTLISVIIGSVGAWLLFAHFETSKKNLLSIFMASLLFLLHPFNVELLTFPEVNISTSVAFLLAVVAFILVTSRLGSLRAAVLVFCFALSVYQVVLNLVVICILAFLLFRCRNWADSRIFFYRSTLFLLTSVGIYLLLIKGTSALTGVALEGRAVFLSGSELLDRAGSVMSATLNLLTFPTLVESSGTRFVALSLVTVCAMIYIRSNLRAERWRAVAVLPLFVGLGSVAAIGVVMAGKVWWPVPRVLASVSLILPIVLLFAYAETQHRLERFCLIALSSALLFAYAAISYVAYHDQRTLNSLDQQLAREISRGVLKNSDSVVIVNKHMRWSHGVRLRTVVGDMNISAFAVQSSYPGLFLYSTGRLLSFGKVDEAAAAWCESVMPWPSEAAVRRVGRATQFCI